MKKWNKIIIDRSNKITKVNKLKNFKDFSEELGGYDVNEYYKNKESFFKFYFSDRLVICSNYLKSSINPFTKTLSIASGHAISELSLISNNFDITCSDLEIPQCYEALKKLFGHFNYLKLNILKDTINTEFDNIYSISTCYVFSDQNLEKFFINVHKMLKKNGILILDHAGSEDNLTSFFFNDIYLVIEAHLIYYLSKIFNKKIGFKFYNNFGYRRKNRDIKQFAKKFGFEFIDIKEYDYLTELQRSVFISKIIEYFQFSTKFFTPLGKIIPYIRIFKFRKI
jgi:hypothetical protein